MTTILALQELAAEPMSYAPISFPSMFVCDW
jgi:hypothetical protein